MEYNGINLGFKPKRISKREEDVFKQPYLEMMRTPEIKGGVNKFKFSIKAREEFGLVEGKWHIIPGYKDDKMFICKSTEILKKGSSKLHKDFTFNNKELAKRLTENFGISMPIDSPIYFSLKKVEGLDTALHIECVLLTDQREQELMEKSTKEDNGNTGIWVDNTNFDPRD